MIDRNFLTRIGLQKDQIILDFGCGEGHYTIPAAKVVGTDGIVYAADKDETILAILMKKAALEGIKNIVPINTEGDLQIKLRDKSVDIILIFDILHYFNVNDRKTLYTELSRVLKSTGFLIIYPKHNKHDFPMWNLSNKTLEDIINEIEQSNFHLEKKSFENLIHNGSRDEGFILIFKKNTN